MDNETSFLAEEIIKDIHKRLPVKSLIRCQCVCKHWRRLIRSRSFIDQHLHQNPSLLFQRDLLRYYSIDCKLQLQAPELRNHPSINPLNVDIAMIVGSCNGLLCVEIFHRYNTSPPQILLWNPANREVRHVPITSRYTDSDRCEILFGFGFSRTINDYKIVRAHWIDRVEVFSLRRGSWKRMRFGNLKGLKLHSHGVTINGVIFWIGLKVGKAEDDSEENESNREEDEDHIVEREVVTHWNYVIVSFDIANEVFTLMPMPVLGYDANKKLTVYGNKLAMLCKIWGVNGKQSNVIDLWVMEESSCASGETYIL